MREGYDSMLLLPARSPSLGDPELNLRCASPSCAVCTIMRQTGHKSLPLVRRSRGSLFRENAATIFNGAGKHQGIDARRNERRAGLRVAVYDLYQVGREAGSR